MLLESLGHPVHLAKMQAPVGDTFVFLENSEVHSFHARTLKGRRSSLKL